MKREVIEMKKQIREQFEIKDLGNIKFFLSMIVECDRETWTMFLSQQTYQKKIYIDSLWTTVKVV